MLKIWCLCFIWCKNVDRRRNYGPKSKSKMAAVRHLGIVVSSYGTTHEVFLLGHIISLSNFMLIRWVVLKLWQFEFFADLAWNAYSRPKNFGFRGSEPLNVIDHHRDPPKGTSLAGTALTCRFWYRSVHWCDLCAIWRNKKGEERNIQVENWVFAQTTHVDAAICGLACRVVFGR